MTCWLEVCPHQTVLTDLENNPNSFCNSCLGTHFGELSSVSRLPMQYTVVLAPDFSCHTGVCFRRSGDLSVSSTVFLVFCCWPHSVFILVASLCVQHVFMVVLVQHHVVFRILWYNIQSESLGVGELLGESPKRDFGAMFTGLCCSILCFLK